MRYANVAFRYMGAHRGSEAGQRFGHGLLVDLRGGSVHAQSRDAGNLLKGPDKAPHIGLDERREVRGRNETVEAEDITIKVTYIGRNDRRRDVSAVHPALLGVFQFSDQRLGLVSHVKDDVRRIPPGSQCGTSELHVLDSIGAVEYQPFLHDRRTRAPHVGGLVDRMVCKVQEFGGALVLWLRRRRRRDGCALYRLRVDPSQTIHFQHHVAKRYAFVRSD